MLKYLTTIVFVLSACAASAEEIRPLAAHRVSLGAMEGVVYVSRQPDGLRVVATLVEGERGTPVRVIATLADGQSIQLSVPRAVNEVEDAVELAREGDVLVLRDPLEPLTASIEPAR